MLKLSVKVFWHFFKTNKLLFAFLCLIQIVSIFATLFTYSYFVSYADANKNYDVYKTYSVYFNDTAIDDAEMICDIEEFCAKCTVDVNAVTIRATVRDKILTFDYLYYLNHVTHGRYFTNDEFATNQYVIISGEEGAIAGDKVLIYNDQYTVIGAYPFGGFDLLPISAMEDIPHSNTSLSIVLDEYLNDEEHEKNLMVLAETFGDVEIVFSERIESVESLWKDSTTVIYIGMFLLSMINVAFVYLYILEKNRKIIYVYRLNGATRMDCIYILSNVISIMAAMSLLCGCAFSKCILPGMIEYVQFEDFIYSLEFYDYISMSVLYSVVIMMVSAPVITKYVKNVYVSNKR